MKLALSESEIWNDNFEDLISMKLRALLEYSAIVKTNDGKYKKSKKTDTKSIKNTTCSGTNEVDTALPVIALSTGECESNRHTVAEAPLKNNTLVTAPEERGPRKGLVNGPSG